MKIVLKPKNSAAFTAALKAVKPAIGGEENGMAWIYKTGKGEYRFYKGPENFAFVEFEGKRRSFGMTSYFKVKRIKRRFGEDKIMMSVGDKQFEMTVAGYESSAPSKPFWVNCTKEEYRALQKLKAY